MVAQHSKSKPHHSRRGPRPFWSGTIAFGLVNVPVHLFPGQRTSRVSMRMIGPQGMPVERKYYCPTHNRDVHPEHLLRGYEVAEGEYVIVRDEELEAIEPKKSREIDLRRFVDLEQASTLHFDRSYLLTPAGDSSKAYRLLAEVMERSALAGIATFVMRGKEYLVAILAERGILRAQTLRFPEEVRSPEDVDLPEVEPADERTVKEFLRHIKQHEVADLGSVDLRDRYQERLAQLVADKLAADKEVIVLKESAKEPHGESEDTPREEIDLLETIRQSLAATDDDGTGNGRVGSNGKTADRRLQANEKQLDELSKSELYARAQQIDLPGRSSMTKQELVAALAASTGG